MRSLGGSKLNEELLRKIVFADDESTNLRAAEKQHHRQYREKGKTALHGTSKPLRKNSNSKDDGEEEKGAALEEAHILPEDEADAEEHLMDVDDPEEYLNIVQLLSILLIPTLSRAVFETKTPPELLADRSGKEPPSNCWKRFLWERQIKMGLADEVEFQSLRPQPESLLQNTLLFMIKSLDTPDEHTKADTSQYSYPVLNADVVLKLLEAHGEYERAQDKVLVDQMVECCQSSSGLLDLGAWLNALTHDVQQYEVGVEDRISTHTFDVWGFSTYKEWEDCQVEHAGEEEEDDDNYKIKRRRTQSNIDFAVDPHASVSLAAAIWTFYICTSLLYLTLLQTLPGLQDTCEPSFGCQLLGTIQVWLTFAIILVLMGFVLIIPLSMGNNAVERSPWRNLFVALLTAAYCWVPFAVVEWYESQAEVRICFGPVPLSFHKFSTFCIAAIRRHREYC